MLLCVSGVGVSAETRYGARVSAPPARAARPLGRIPTPMHMSLTAASNPFTASTFWRENTNGPGHVVFLHIGEDLSLLMSLDELLSLHLAVGAALDDAPDSLGAATEATH
jgi:hypothetical protein